MLKKLAAVVLALGLVFSLAVPVAVYAEGDSGDVRKSDDSTEVKTESNESSDSNEVKTKIQTKIDDAKEKVQARLTETKLRVCKKRENQITTIMSRSAGRVQKHLEVFNKISERVQAFYAKKGNVSATYDQKLAAVNTAKAAVEADVTTLKSLKGFSCDGTNPKGDASSFKTALKQAQEDLKTYRTAIKDLIVDVKTAQSQGDGNDQQ